jgi:SAM-dependent methyltransferase
MEQLKSRMRDTWMAGDFGQIARYTAVGAAEFVDRLPIAGGMQVLDVACGTGNLAIPAARKGALVTGVDIAVNLLEQARKRAASEALNAVFQEGDAENLPFPDASFDVVMSMFGAMFAPRPERVAAELARVCKPGGTIAMANWTPGGFVGKSFQISSRHVPPQPGNLPAPVLWGDETVVHERFAALVSNIETRTRTVLFDYPMPPREVVQFFREYFGPTRVAYSRLDEPGRAAFTADLEAIWNEYNEAKDGNTRVAAEYLEVIAVK